MVGEINPLDPKPGLKGQTEQNEDFDKLEGLLKNFVDGLDELNKQKSSSDNNNNEKLPQHLKVIDGGVDPIADTKMALEIDGKIYTVSYGPYGIDLSTLKAKNAKDGPVSKEIVQLVKEHSKAIREAAFREAKGHGPEVIV